jgi:hypothetical protein
MRGTPDKAIDRLRALMASGLWSQALALASRWGDLGVHKARIQRGHQARWRPDFFRQLGLDPEALMADGKLALEERYGKQPPREDAEP